MFTTNRLIKNTAYLYLSQFVALLFPLFLTPFILSKIGEVEFGIYAIVLGYVGTLGIFDLSVSSAFVRFIAEHITKREDEELNRVVNTGLLFYIVLSLVLAGVGFALARPLIALMNIPESLREMSVLVFRISLAGFFFSSAFSVFVSLLISMQEMYVTSLIAMIMGCLNFVGTLLVLNAGLGLMGMACVQVGVAFFTAAANVSMAMLRMPQIRISPFHWSRQSMHKMMGMGIQMQVSKLSGFAAEKYDEFLLGLFTTMNYVAYYNIGARIARMARIFPAQLIPPVAPVATEFKTRSDEEKLTQLYADTTRYLTLVTLPIMLFICVSSDLLVHAWIGQPIPRAYQILQILVVGQLVNLTFSAPGNSITPNIGIPRIQMFEGLIALGINLVLSYLLIRFMGGLGAAIGSTVAVIVAAAYVYATSAKLFRRGRREFFRSLYVKPLLAGGAAVVATFVARVLLEPVVAQETRLSMLAMIIVLGSVFIAVYGVVVANSGYLAERDRRMIAHVLFSVIPNSLVKRLQRKLLVRRYPQGSGYEGELVSIFVVTHNRLSMVRRCLDALLPTLDGINWELIVWDNNSTDGSREYLQQLQTDGRMRVVHHPENIGTNAKGKAAELCTGDFIIGIDDDVIQFPAGWVQDMVYAYKNIPAMGYLATNVLQDNLTDGAKQPQHLYRIESYDTGRLALEVGPTGGWCFLLSRDIYNTVGPLRVEKDRIFFMEDANYVNRAIDMGFKHGILQNVRVYHATGRAHNEEFDTVFAKKMNDYARGHSVVYEFWRKISRLFSPMRYVRSLLVLADHNS